MIVKSSVGRLRVFQNSGNGVIEFAKAFIGSLMFFQVISLGKLFFRAQSGGEAFLMLGNVFTRFEWNADANTMLMQILWFVAPFFVMNIFEHKADDVCFIFKWHQVVKQLVYFLLLALLISGGVSGGKEFIYFQF